MLIGDELPGTPNNDRVMVKPDPPPEKEGALWVPDIAKHRANKGVLMAAGLLAHDKLADNDDRIGDRIWWGQYAGVIEEWDHITEPGREGCEHTWSRGPSPGDRITLFLCDCGAKRLKEPTLVMNVEDILVNEDKEARRRRGEIVLFKAQDKDGKTVHRYMTPAEIEAAKKKAEAEAQEAERQRQLNQYPWGFNLGSSMANQYSQQAQAVYNQQALNYAGLYDNPQLNDKKKDKE